ncbi:MAG: DUF1361 domain-containing protein [Oscillatoriales cyanobacterium]|nr:MAG: DUF1361 domain-containing protein [Oscillatoriales cyanobacterium]
MDVEATGQLLGHWLKLAISLWRENARWMLWNLLLAWVPVALAWWLFCRSPRRPNLLPRSILWWLVAGIFVAFLPNAPYVVTDLIHLVHDIRYGPVASYWTVVLLVIPQYVVFVVAGFAAYVLSLIWLADWLRAIGWSDRIPWIEQGLHGLSAIGVFLGRFWRFNSWDLITQPDALLDRVSTDLGARRPLATIGLLWVILAILHALSQPLALGYRLYRQQQQQLKQQLKQQGRSPRPRQSDRPI